jgi:signal transduction histidine kinase/CheY-like chemotaxis protein
MSIKVDTNFVWHANEMPNNFIENQYVGMFLKRGVSSHFGLILCAFAMYAIMLSKMDGFYPHIFLFFTLIVNAIRILFTNKILGKSVDKVATISKLHLLHGTTHALPLMGFSFLGDIDKSIITIILLTISTAAVSTTNGYKYKYLWFVAPLLLPLSLAWALVNNSSSSQHWINYIIAFLIIAYLFYLIGLGKDLFAVFNESCHIRFSESEKNKKLMLALDEAKNASLAKTRFLASASHDLRQPMHTIGVLLAALRMRTLDERSREIVEVLGTVNNSLSSQLDGLLDISKLDAGVVTPDLQIYKLGDLVRAHAAKISLSDAKQSLYVRVHASSDALVQTDIVLFERVLMNLTGNAIKFTEYGGVDITVHATEQKVILEIADTGIGIADDFKSLVFQEFYQIGNAERDRTAGLGLGLSIVKRICRLLDIQIHLISVPNQGSRFVLTMHLVRDAHHITLKKTIQEEVLLPAMTVLVIDDEVGIRTGMRLLLEELGCIVVLADGIDQAVVAAKVQKFNVIFSDYRLKGHENGIDAIGHVRVIQPGVDAVLITGDTASERLQSAQNAGLQMLHKPVSFEAILKQLRKTVGYL